MTAWCRNKLRYNQWPLRDQLFFNLCVVWTLNFFAIVSFILITSEFSNTTFLSPFGFWLFEETFDHQIFAHSLTLSTTFFFVEKLAFQRVEQIMDLVHQSELNISPISHEPYHNYAV